MARFPGTIMVKRRDETTSWEQQWNRLREVRARDVSVRLDTYTAGKCDGYQYLFKIYAALAPDHEILGECLAVLQALKLDGPDWRRQLDQISRVGGGDMEDNFAFAAIHHYVGLFGGKNVKRAAECAVATMGLYPDSQSFRSAVTRCTEVWTKYTDGRFCPLGDNVVDSGLFVRVRTDNLQKDEDRKIIDPYDLRPIPKKGKWVNDTTFWRSLIALGLIKIVQKRSRPVL
jgi:hypothetical protein